MKFCNQSKMCNLTLKSNMKSKIQQIFNLNEKIKNSIENLTDQNDRWYETFASQISKWFQPAFIWRAASENCIGLEVTSLRFYLK